MTTYEKFCAAVNVIRNLPKDGAFQPSTELMLKFYSYYKQATDGPVAVKKPPFWDVPGQVKWNSWKKLGDMPKEVAMEAYVEELKTVVETMSYNANVERFMSSLGAFYDSVPAEEVDLVLGPVIEKVKAKAAAEAAAEAAASGITFTSSVSTEFNDTADNYDPIKFENGDMNGSCRYNNSISSPIHVDDSDRCDLTRSAFESDDDDEFTDPMETTPVLMRKFVPMNQNELPKSIPSSIDANLGSIKILQKTVEQLQKDLDLITGRVRALETAKPAKKELKKQSRLFQGKSTSTIAFIVLWPFAAYYIINKLSRKAK